MPNWCQNQVTFTNNNPAVINEIIFAFEECNLLQHFVPLNEWNCTEAVEKWGTKWDIKGSEDQFELDDNKVTLWFDSAWAPPIPFYEAMEARRIRVEAYYYEPGMCFCGEYNYGVDQRVEYDTFDGIPSNIVEVFGIEDWESAD